MEEKNGTPLPLSLSLSFMENVLELKKTYILRSSFQVGLRVSLMVFVFLFTPSPLSGVSLIFTYGSLINSTAGQIYQVQNGFRGRGDNGIKVWGDSGFRMREQTVVKNEGINSGLE